MPDAAFATIPALLRVGALGPERWDEALAEVLRVDSSLLGVDRVSFWTFQDEPTAILCELGYVASSGVFERGTVLLERDAGEYFSLLRTVMLVTIADARTDPRMRSVSDYLEPRDIGALLDVPVFARGRLAGVLCHENVGGPREWTAREAELALGLGGTVSALLEARARSQAEEAERRSAFLARTSATLARVLDLDHARQLAVRSAIPMLGEMCTLLGYDGTRAWRIAHAHQDPHEQPLLDELTNNYGGDIAGPGIGVQALREGQSLLLTACDPNGLREFGLEEGAVELLGRLRVRSVMAVPFRVRSSIVGCLTFASATRTYSRTELELAEAYARQVGVLLANITLHARARQAVQARDEFLALAAHELRTPLAALAFAAGELARNVPDDAPAALRRAAAIVRRQTDRLTRLSDLLLAASSSDARERPIGAEDVDLVALVRQVASEHARVLERAGCEVRIETSPGPIYVRGDHDELEVVVVNLLDNAAKFGPGHPIDISVTANDERAVLVVRDHGIGIPEEQHARLFRRFERGVSWKHFGGLGLGLHVSARIVAAHGGSIRAESRPGEGATFTVELPRAAHEERVAPPAPSAPARARS